jgi:hypothetical protein
MGRGWRIAIGVVAGLVVVLGLAQLILPRVAASRISSRVGRYGHVQSVSVSAWPALKLLWGDADSVHVHVGAIALSTSQAAALVHEGHDVDTMDVTAESVRLGSLHLTDAAMHKHGDVATGRASVSEADVKAALPSGFEVQLLRSGQGQVEVRATGGLFGVGASVNAIATASEGKLVAHPVGFLIEGLQLTLFSNARVHVLGVGASVQSEQPRMYRLTMSALVS